jgi:hypothetical protein
LFKPLIKSEVRTLRRSTTGIDRENLAIRLRNQPKAITTDGIHVRVNNGDRGCNRNSCFHCVTTLAQHFLSSFRSKIMGCNYHSVLRTRRQPELFAA